MHRRINAFISRFLSCALVAASACAFAQKTMPVGSESMEPTIHRGDSVSVNLLVYIKGKPARWDVVVFWSAAHKAYFAQRVVGLPGDTIAYGKDKQLRINGSPVALEASSIPYRGGVPSAKVFIESFDGHRHLVQLIPDALSIDEFMARKSPLKEQCALADGDLRCKVPAGHYFLMGDNRDNCVDSRYLGFISETDIGGRIDGLSTAP